MSKVLLVSSNWTDEPYPVYPLGLSMVAMALARAGHEVRQFDFAAGGKSEKQFRQELLSFEPEFVGISIRNIDNVDSFSAEESWHLGTDRRLVEIIREMGDATVIVGGSGYSLLPEEILGYLGGDFGVVGEGERTACNLIADLAEGRQIPRIVHTGADLIDGTAVAEPLWDDSILRYYRDLSLLGIQTKRGCAYQCLYCSYSNVEGDGIRYRDAQAVVDDVEMLHSSFGVTRLFFTDSVFNDQAGHYLSVTEELIRRDLPVTWSAFFRPEKIDRESLKLLKRAGLKGVEAGTDAACNETLSALHKPFTFDDVVAFQEACRREEIACAHYVMFGGPDETEATLRQGLANLERLRECVVLGFAGIRIFPRTGLYARALQEGLLTKEASLLKPVFYFSPRIDRQVMVETVKQAFGHRRERIFPPTEASARLKVARRMGFSSSLWERLIRFGPHEGNSV